MTNRYEYKLEDKPGRKGNKLHGPVNSVQDCWPVPKGMVPLGSEHRGFGVYVTPELLSRVGDLRRRATALEELPGKEMVGVAVAVACEMLASGKPTQVKSACRMLHDFGRLKMRTTGNTREYSVAADPEEGLGDLPGQ